MSYNGDSKMIRVDSEILLTIFGITVVFALAYLILNAIELNATKSKEQFQIGIECVKGGGNWIKIREYDNDNYNCYSQKSSLPQYLTP